MKTNHQELVQGPMSHNIHRKLGVLRITKNRDVYYMLWYHLKIWVGSNSILQKWKVTKWPNPANMLKSRFLRDKGTLICQHAYSMSICFILSCQNAGSKWFYWLFFVDWGSIAPNWPNPITTNRPDQTAFRLFDFWQSRNMFSFSLSLRF